jgi:signal transduction histidine kinase
MMAADFSRLVSLACHDLRTPLATMQGFTKTLLRREDLDEKAGRWLGMIETAGEEMVELIELLSIAARIEGGRHDPVVREADSLELAQAAVPAATGVGAVVNVDPAAVERSLAALAEAARRHGGTDVAVSVDGPRIAIEPVGSAVAPIVLGEELKDLRAAVGVRALRALGGAVEPDGERVVVTLPSA